MSGVGWLNQSGQKSRPSPSWVVWWKGHLHVGGRTQISDCVFWYLNAASFKCNVLHKYVPSVHNQVRQQKKKEFCWRVCLSWFDSSLSLFTQAAVTLYYHSVCVQHSCFCTWNMWANRKNQLHGFYINGLVSHEVWNAINTEAIDVFPTHPAVEMHFCLNICEKHNRLWRFIEFTWTIWTKDASALTPFRINCLFKCHKAFYSREDIFTNHFYTEPKCKQSELS